MENTVITLTGSHTADIRTLTRLLKQGISADLISESQQEPGNARIILLCFEKYYLRNNSHASLTILLTEDDAEQTAEIIGFGGGNGLFNISFGANSNFANTAVKILKEHGFS